MLTTDTPSFIEKEQYGKKKKMKKKPVSEYGGKEKYASKTAKKKHEGKESKKTEMKEKKVKK
jgi:hypothetical protein